MIKMIAESFLMLFPLILLVLGGFFLSVFFNQRKHTGPVRN